MASARVRPEPKPLSRAGRKALTDEVRLTILEKLRQIVNEKHGGNRSAFAHATGVPYPTVTRWFSDKKAKRTDLEAPAAETGEQKKDRKANAPDLAWLLQIADREELNYDWLLGRGTVEYRGAPGSKSEWENYVWRGVILSLRLPEGATRQHAARLLPTGRQMLKEVARHYDSEFEKWWHFVGDHVREGAQLDDLLLSLPADVSAAKRW